jgi:putative inorganic carbon (HCO3(-)) transporter
VSHLAAGSITPGWWRVASEPVEDSRLPFVALMTFTFILVIAPQTFVPVLGVFRIALLTGLVAIATHLLGRFIRRQPLMVWSREMSTAACLVAWAVVTVPFGHWPGGSAAFLTGIYFKTVAVFWLLGNVVNTLPRLRAIVWGLSLMSAPLALTGISNFLSGAFVVVTPGVQAVVNRIQGYDAPLAQNPNDLALLLNLMIPPAVALFLSARKPALRAILLAIITLSVVAVIFTFSRAGFLTLGAMFAIYAWKLRRRPESPWIWTALVVALALTPLLPSGYTDRITTIFNVESDPTGSSQARWADTKAAFRILVRNPVIGAGVGQNVLALNEERGAAWKEVHNVYLEYGVELGLPGLTLFVMLLIFSLQSTMFAQRQADRLSAGRDLFYLAEAIQVSLLAFCVAGMFHPGGYQFAFYYFAGLATATRLVAESLA